MIDSILDQLKNGDAEIVKKYKFQKINGLRIEGAAENEVNEMLKNAVMSVVSADSQIADEVIIPALLQWINKLNLNPYYNKKFNYVKLNGAPVL